MTKLYRDRGKGGLASKSFFKRAPLALLLLAGAIVTPASAQKPDEYLLTANYILEHCRRVARDPGSGDVEGAFCAGQIAGLMLAGHFLVGGLRFCAPDTATRQQGVRVVVAFLDANPHRLHEDFAVLALEAMRKAWRRK
jgi:Rap1a immunity proteins